MKASELRDLSIGELKERQVTLAQEVFNLRFQRAANQLEDKRKIRNTRKEIARVLTVIAQKEQSEGRTT
jgi:large subunit ribosomal protein L29